MCIRDRYYAQRDLWKNKKNLRYPPFNAIGIYNTILCIQIRQCRTFIRIMEIKGSCFVFTQMVFVYHDCMCCIIVFFISNLMLHLLISFSTILDSEGFDSVESQQAGSTVQTLLNTRGTHTSTSSFPNPGLLHLHPPPSEEVVRWEFQSQRWPKRRRGLHPRWWQQGRLHRNCWRSQPSCHLCQCSKTHLQNTCVG